MRVPVVVAPGTTVYKDITLQFDVDSGGNVTLSGGYPMIVDSQAFLVLSIQPGLYATPKTILNGKGIITITGPGVMDGGVTAFTINAGANADGCTYPSTGTFYVGPIANNPLAARLQKAGITSTAWSYGIGYCTCGSNAWGNNSIIGVSQVGNTITIASFTWVGTDKNLPADQVTYTLVQQ